MTMTSQSPAKEIELRAVIAVLHRQARVIVLTTGVIFAAAALFLLVSTERYTASALVLVDPDQRGILDEGRQYPSSTGRENAQVDSEVEILRSDAVALAVIRAKGLVADPEFGGHVGLGKRLARLVGVANAAAEAPDDAISRTLARFKQSRTVRRKGLTYLISVSASSNSPEKAADLANELARTYIERQVSSKVENLLRARDVLREQMQSAQLALAMNEADYDRFIAAHLETISDTGNAELTALRNRLQQLEKERQAMQRRGDAAPNLAPDAIPASASARAADETVADAARADARLRSLETEISGLREKLRRTMIASDLPAEVLTGLFALQQDANVALEQYRNLHSRMRDLETRAKVQMSDSRIISPAMAPGEPAFPNRNLVLLVALAASLGLGVSLAFLKEYYIGGITSPSQLAELIRQETAALLPLSFELNSNRLSVADRIVDAPLSSYSENIRKLRAAIDQNLRNIAPADRPAAGKVILVTSTLPDEGKTTTALALARTYALSGRKTLLMDADLRKPSVHRHLGHEPQTGFVDFLMDNADADMAGSFYARDPASPAAVIMGAARSAFPTDQLLASARFSSLLEQAREVYDVIVIDSAPILPVVDARYVAPHADAVVFVVKWASTNQGDIRSATAPLSAAMSQGSALVPVLSHVPEAVGRTKYGAYANYSAAT